MTVDVDALIKELRHSASLPLSKRAADALDAMTAAMHRIKRTAEMSEGIMRDRRRTGGWEGADKVADQFRRIADLAALAPPETEK